MSEEVLVMVLAPEVIPIISREDIARTMIATLEQEFFIELGEHFKVKVMFFKGSPVYRLEDNGMLVREG